LIKAELKENFSKSESLGYISEFDGQGMFIGNKKKLIEKWKKAKE
jgi:hypothetical protein